MKKLLTIPAAAIFALLLNSGCHTNPQRPNAKSGEKVSSPYNQPGQSGYNGSGDGIKHNMLNGTGDGLKNADPNQVYTGGSGAKAALPTAAVKDTSSKASGTGSAPADKPSAQTVKPSSNASAQKKN